MESGHRIASPWTNTAQLSRLSEVLPTARLVTHRGHDSNVSPFALCADPTVMHHSPSVPRHDESTALIANIQMRSKIMGSGSWAIERRSDGRFLSFAGLTEVQSPTPNKAVWSLAGSWHASLEDKVTHSKRPRRPSNMVSRFAEWVRLMSVQITGDHERWRNG